MIFSCPTGFSTLKTFGPLFIANGNLATVLEYDKKNVHTKYKQRRVCLVRKEELCLQKKNLFQHRKLSFENVENKISAIVQLPLDNIVTNCLKCHLFSLPNKHV